MTIDDKTWQEEQAYLKGTLEMIKEQIGSSGDRAETYRENIISAQKSMWEERSTQVDPSKEIDGAVIAWQHQSYMMMEAKSMQFFKKIKSKLELMIETPYFARIDFKEEGEEAESLYIGMGKVAGNNFMDIRVYDWRSPVCSIFYNYEIGLAEYECPAGIIRGELTLKRQYKIQDELIRFMFDSGLKINDEMLQEILGQSTDDKMKTIVTSIQKEQDSLIRDETHDILMIQGTAGSGKTSIALHRIAYILYRQRETLKANNMVIFSPNQVFNDYISDVLPELGEENVNLTTFNDYLESIIDTHHQMEDWNSQMEYIMTSGLGHGSLRKQCIEYKTSMAFVGVLKAYVAYIKVEGFEFEDIKYEGKTIIFAKDIRKLYIDHQLMLSPKKSLNRIRLRLNKLLDPFIAKKRREVELRFDMEGEMMQADEKREKLFYEINQSFNDVRRKINEMTRFNIFYIYKSLFRHLWIQKKVNDGKAIVTKEVSQYTVRRLESQYLYYEDALALAYLKGELEGIPLNSAIKHVVIDEAQDYSFLHYEIFNQIFHKAKFTLLGDLNQSINPFLNIGKYELISEIFDREKAARVTLQRSYRSSKQISDFCSKLLKGEDQTIYLDREGNEPIVMDCGQVDAMVKRMVERVKFYSQEGHKSIALICKTEKESKKLFKLLEDQLDSHLLTRSDIHYKKGLLVVPSYLAKGLEFDAVIIGCHALNNYTREEERNLFYTVCSRALHELEILYTGEKPIFLK